MRTPRDRRDRTPVEWYPPRQACPACQQPLIESYHQPRWMIQRDQPVNVVSHVLACGHTHGERRAAVYRPYQDDPLAWRGDTWGLDVVARLGERRYRDHLSITKIRDPLTSEATLSIAVTEVAVRCEVVLALVTTVARQEPALLEPWRRLGGIVLAMAGVQPEKRHATLDMWRDVRSGRV